MAWRRGGLRYEAWGLQGLPEGKGLNLGAKAFRGANAKPEPEQIKRGMGFIIWECPIKCGFRVMTRKN